MWTNLIQRSCTALKGGMPAISSSIGRSCLPLEATQSIRSFSNRGLIITGNVLLNRPYPVQSLSLGKVHSSLRTSSVFSASRIISQNSLSNQMINGSSIMANQIRSITDSKRQDLTNKRRRRNILIYNRRVKIAKKMRRLWYGIKKADEHKRFQQKIDLWKQQNL